MPTRDPQVGWLQDTRVPGTEPPMGLPHAAWPGSLGRLHPARLGASGGQGGEIPLRKHNGDSWKEKGRSPPCLCFSTLHGAELQGSPWDTRSCGDISRERDHDPWRRGRGLAAPNGQLPLTQAGGTTALVQEETGDPQCCGV